MPLLPSFPGAPSIPDTPSCPSRPTTPLGPGRPTTPWEEVRTRSEVSQSGFPLPSFSLKVAQTVFPPHKPITLCLSQYNKHDRTCLGSPCSFLSWLPLLADLTLESQKLRRLFKMWTFLHLIGNVKCLTCLLDLLWLLSALVGHEVQGVPKISSYVNRRVKEIWVLWSCVLLSDTHGLPWSSRTPSFSIHTDLTLRVNKY